MSLSIRTLKRLRDASEAEDELFNWSDSYYVKDPRQDSQVSLRRR